jgi:regulator of sigma E protease
MAFDWSRIPEFIIGLGFLMFVHELGHYVFSRIFGIEVEEFGFGLPPKITRLFRFKGTDFTLNYIPFGAFVRPKGENDPTILGGMAAAAPWKRLLILLGGPLMNLLVAILLFSVYFSFTGVPVRDSVQIKTVDPNSPAESAGLRVDDVFVSIQGQKITSIDQTREIVTANLGQEITVIYRRGEELFTTSATPRVNPPPDQGALGIRMDNESIQVSWLQSFPYAVREIGIQVEALIHLPGKLIRREISGPEARIISIVGMGQIYNMIPYLIDRIGFLAAISVALGLTNLLPLPALDGGRIIFLLPEIILRRRVPARYENMVHAIGLISLIILMVFITARDVIDPVRF